MTKSWQRLGPVAWGGSVLSIQTNDPGDTWAATGGGLLARQAEGWRPVNGGPAQVGLVAAPGTNWWVAGLNGGLASTFNTGRTWWEPFIDGIDEPLTCITTSPRWATDRIMLAGTAGGGIIKTIDGGRRWLGVNFGLQDYTVLALAPATDWSHREIIFAGTLDGVYRSSGGGRAWKHVGLGDLPVQALVASVDFADNGVALAGAEGAGLFRTTDGGFTWELAGDVLGREVSINALARLAGPEGEVFIAATDGGVLWRSEDGGLSWAKSYENGEPVLTLSVSHDGTQIWAGTSENGALASHDLGCTWTPDETLCAWGFRRLLGGDDGSVYAWSPTGGVWRSTDGGAKWERVAGGSHYEPIFAYLPVQHGGALEARTEALVLRQGDAETSVLEAGDAPVVALAADRNLTTIWAADVFANLARSTNGGKTWVKVEIPWAGQQLLTLVAPEAGALIAATHDADSGSVTIWRLLGDRWESWLERSAQWAGAAIAPAGAQSVWAIIAGEVWVNRAGTEWTQVDTPEDAGTVVALAQTGETRCIIAGRAVLCQIDDGDWESFPLLDEAAAPVDVLILPVGDVLLLDSAGTIWKLGA